VYSCDCDGRKWDGLSSGICWVYRCRQMQVGENQAVIWRWVLNSSSMQCSKEIMRAMPQDADNAGLSSAESMAMGGEGDPRSRPNKRQHIDMGLTPTPMGAGPISEEAPTNISAVCTPVELAIELQQHHRRVITPDRR
jgi:hypothetical protein